MTDCKSFNTIYLGEDKDLPFRISNGEGVPFDLTGATEIEFRFQGIGTETLVKKLSVGATEVVVNEPTNGLVTAKIANTDNLKEGSRQVVWIKITEISGKISIVKAENALTVEKPF